MQRRFLSLLTALLFFSLCALTQPALNRSYFRNPLDIPIELSANFGELRTDHWHMGLDIRTNQKENLPVYAAAAGYIASIGVRPQSFGRFIIIRHSNGLSTLYAHLNDFFPALETYVTEQQYAQESWAIELDFAEDKFPVYKGQFIAYSGNTGGSQGPHLHFEIFDTKSDKRLNPLLFNFSVADEVSPNLVKLALYDRSRSTFEQIPTIYNLKNTDTGYIIPKVSSIKTGLKKLSFGIQTYDRQSGSNNPNGIYSAKLYLDDEPQLAFILDSISYDETLYMNAQIDYPLRANGGAFYQHLSRLPGDHGAAYHEIKNDGVIDLTDTAEHVVSIEVKDPKGNSSVLNFIIQYSDSLAALLAPVTAHEAFVPDRANQFRRPDFEVDFPAKALYDSIYAVYYRKTATSSNYVSAVHQLNDATFPLHEEITVRIKPTRPIPEEWKDKILIQRSGRGTTFRRAKLNGEWLSAKFGDLGIFQAIVDLTPPQVNELGKPSKGDTINLSAATRIIFTPTDNTGIRSFRAELNGKWLRFTNDKSRNWIYVFDEQIPYGVYELSVTVEDLVGNATTKTWWFKREPYTPPKKKPAKKKSSSKKKAPVKKKK